MLDDVRDIGVQSARHKYGPEKPRSRVEENTEVRRRKPSRTRKRPKQYRRETPLVTL